MKRLLFVFVCLSFFTGAMYSKDKTKAFEISFPEIKVSNSLYNKLEFLDSRINQEDLGFVQTSMFNHVTYMVDEIPLAVQFDSLFRSVIDETAQEKTMLLQLRNIHFSEVTRKMSEKGYCHIRVSLFEKDGSDYYFLNTLDTLIDIKAMDVTGRLIKTSAQLLSNFLVENLQALPKEEEPYMLTDIRNIDYYEKNNLRLYSTDEYEDGIYYSFRSFSNQIPDETGFTSDFNRNGMLKELKYTEDSKTGKKKRVKPKDIYAVVISGKPYIASEKTYIPIYKDGDEFRFINDGTIKVDYGSYVAGTVAANIITGALFGIMVIPVPVGSVEEVEMTIDHLSGNFIRIPNAVDKRN